MTVLPEHLVHDALRRHLERIETLLVRVLLKENILMSDVDDLKSALGDLTTEAVTDLENVIAQLQTAVASNNTAALQALTQQAKDTTAKLKADMASLAGVPVPPAPTV